MCPSWLWKCLVPAGVRSPDRLAMTWEHLTPWWSLLFPSSIRWARVPFCRRILSNIVGLCGWRRSCVSKHRNLRLLGKKRKELITLLVNFYCLFFCRLGIKGHWCYCVVWQIGLNGSLAHFFEQLKIEGWLSAGAEIRTPGLWATSSNVHVCSYSYWVCPRSWFESSGSHAGT